MDLSNGYEKIASEYISARSEFPIGTSLVREWAKSLSPHSKILDIGCGNGIPVTQAAIDSGHSLFAIDASQSMIQAFTDHFPHATAKCEPVEHSDFFEEKFDGVIAIGIIFLLEKLEQIAMIRRVGEILRPSGQFLFSAPIEAGKWQDAMTGSECLSLGKDKYAYELSSAGMQILETYSDEGSNNHYNSAKNGIG